MAEVQIAIEKQELTRQEIWADLVKKAVPPWKDQQQFIDVGWDILSLLRPATEIITPEVRKQPSDRGSMHLIMNHYFFPEIPIMTAVIDDFANRMGREGVITAVANMPQDLVIPQSIPILIPPIHYFKRYNREQSAFKNIFSGPQPLLYLFNQYGFVNSDKKTRISELSPAERLQWNMESAFDMVDRIEGNKDGILYPSGDRMPGPQHPGFLGWSLMHQFIKNGHVSPVNFWVHEGFLPNEIIKGVTTGNRSPSKLLCVDTLESEHIQGFAADLLQQEGLVFNETEVANRDLTYQHRLRGVGARLGVGVLDYFKKQINPRYMVEHPEYDWGKYIRYTSKPTEI